MKSVKSNCQIHKFIYNLLSDEPVSKPATIEVDVNDSCIWDSDEINVLRDVYKTVRATNTKLDVRSKQLEKRNSYLESKLRDINADIERQGHELTERNKANTRLKIHRDTIEDDLEHAHARLSAMEEIFKEISSEKSSMVKEVHELRVQRDKDRMEKSALDLKLQSAENHIQSEKMAIADKVKLKYQTEIVKLQKTIDTLTAELIQEKKTHNATKRGLNHLRQHFASLPVAQIVPPNSVCKDQVSNFQY